MHASHSSINSYLRCGKAFELEKIKNYPTTPAWYLIGGSAVHAVTEAWDKGDRWATVDLMAVDCLYYEVEKARDIEPDESKWLAAGYGNRQQRFEHWAPKVVDYAEQWKELEWGKYSDIKLVEQDVSTVLPSGIEVRGYVDRVSVVHDSQTIEILDLKSGSTRPDSDQQLGIYSVLVQEYFKNDYYTTDVADYDIIAANYMFKDDDFYEMDVSAWNLETLDRLAQTWYGGVSNQVFLPVRGEGCDRCSVRDACFLQSGDTPVTREYDSLNPNYEG